MFKKIGLMILGSLVALTLMGTPAEASTRPPIPRQPEPVKTKIIRCTPLQVLRVGDRNYRIYRCHVGYVIKRSSR